MKLVGLSLSLCIQDIINGKVNENDVSYIESGTRFETHYQWEQGMQQYCKNYWSKDPARARLLVASFRDMGRLFQPRLQGEEARNISLGHWIYQP